MLPDFTYYQDYTYGGDLCTIGLIVLCLVFFKSSYTTEEKNLKLFKSASIVILFATFSSILYHSFLKDGTGNDLVVTFLHDSTYNLLIGAYGIFIIYMMNIVRLSEKNAAVGRTVVIGIIAVNIIAQAQSYFTHFGFWLERDAAGNRIVHENYYLELYRAAYILCCLFLVYVFFNCRKRLVKKVYFTIAAVIVISISLVILQTLKGTSVLLCFSFTLPIAASLFLFHYNQYDTVTGALEASAFASFVHNSLDMSTSLIFLNMKLKPNEEYEGLSQLLFKYNENYFKNTLAFKLNEELLVLAVKRTQNINFENNLAKLLDDLDDLYDKFQITYNTVIIEANEACVSPNDYVGLAENLALPLKNKSVYRASEADYNRFKKETFIAEQIRDIEKKNDLDDERVLVYCQPVLSTETGRFTTAEALMRLKLPGIGLVFPDEFIPIAEKYNLIHSLSKVILHKTCKEIKFLDENNYSIDRISVNFSMLELKDVHFCDDIISIIEEVGIDCNRIAIEFTESNNEDDFENVKKIMFTLHSKGMKFYLDDFGTGYSNFSRIIGLPIDIIKFDRSLTILSGNDDQSKYMVNSFSDIFAKARYQVLYEGVENEADEMRCKNMNALYLQGYKYSKPVPIEDLRNFLVQKAAV